MLEQGLVLCRASGNRSWLHTILGNLGYASVLQGRLAEGRALLEEAFREAMSTDQQGTLWAARLSNYLEDLKDELIYAKQLAVDEEGCVLVWTGPTAADLPSQGGSQTRPR